ncbi:MAG: pyridoxal phosphate-dependent aminotransferase [Prevotellaceae bacterium]|jgi:aspartate/methionine/tyrosine aminotransferase|nr:pyridoxal phosphate-dependent aminotransferase [Prevotellaceae bacterium]
MESFINKNIVDNKRKELSIASVSTASIREITKLINELEAATGESFIRMEMGVPGIEPTQAAIEAEIAALHRGVASKYPNIEGVPELKVEMPRFVKNFIGVDVPASCCVPSVGSMQGGMAAFLVTTRCHEGRDVSLFIDPGFPVQKTQMQTLGLKYETFDVFNYRGEKLRDKLETYLLKGDIASIIYSNPNNPSWISFTEKELKIIAELADKYDVIAIEDLAYFGMDFRTDISTSGQPPYQPSVANYTDNFVLLISSSKAFSYAGQRIGFVAYSEKLGKRRFPALKRNFMFDEFSRTMIFGALYALSSGVTHSVQYGFAAMLKAANDGTYNFIEHIKIYGEKAQIMKKLFTDNGFYIVYDNDEGRPLADGFYFTVAYPGLDGEELLSELLYYGISAISLGTTGSDCTQGLRACTSLIRMDQMSALEERLKLFHQHHTS